MCSFSALFKAIMGGQIEYPAVFSAYPPDEDSLFNSIWLFNAALPSLPDALEFAKEELLIVLSY